MCLHACKCMREFVWVLCVVYVYSNIYVYMCIHIHTHTHTYIYTHIHTYIHTYMFVFWCTRVCMHYSIRVWVRVWVYYRCVCLVYAWELISMYVYMSNNRWVCIYMIGGKSRKKSVYFEINSCSVCALASSILPYNIEAKTSQIHKDGRR